MNNDINITNIINITGDADTPSVGAWVNLLNLLVAIVGLAGIGLGLYWLAGIALELALGIVESAGNLIGALATGVIDTLVGIARIIGAYGPAALWYAGYGCLGLLGIALLAHAYDRWLEGRPAVVTTARPVRLSQPRVLVLVANSQDQAQQAIAMRPESASYEFIQMPAQKETAEVWR